MPTITQSPATPLTRAAKGALAGLGGGVVFGLLMAMMGMLPMMSLMGHVPYGLVTAAVPYGLSRRSA